MDNDSVLSWAILFVIMMVFVIKTIITSPTDHTETNKYNCHIEKTTADFIWKNEKNKWRY